MSRLLNPYESSELKDVSASPNRSWAGALSIATLALFVVAALNAFLLIGLTLLEWIAPTSKHVLEFRAFILICAFFSMFATGLLSIGSFLLSKRWRYALAMIVVVLLACLLPMILL
ncbi:hypothetical protein LOC67_27165 [Stieleria sp. JC731]|uniref:hypothetical protein n=1 Tax=Stieleria sp. JC731 TaxID=2894195 RepID=UPI001E2E4D10|nr:hypothetical protein [Stieleria sp. JC731]MCC9604251.1 hypothetical protein [Stieleria sp. JC731]